VRELRESNIESASDRSKGIRLRHLPLCHDFNLQGKGGETVSRSFPDRFLHARTFIAAKFYLRTADANILGKMLVSIPVRVSTLKKKSGTSFGLGAETSRTVEMIEIHPSGISNQSPIVIRAHR